MYMVLTIFTYTQIKKKEFRKNAYQYDNNTGYP